MKHKVALVIEDDQALSDIVLNMLNIFDVSAISVYTANEALVELVKRKYDFFIIDLTLPDIPGLDLYRKIIKKYPEYRGKVIFTSGFTIDDEMAEIMKNDGADFLQKPYSIDKFKEVIERWN